MSVSTDAFVPPVTRHIRCSCDRCGAHALATFGWRMQGHCGNCGSFELTPVEAPLSKAS